MEESELEIKEKVERVALIIEKRVLRPKNRKREKFLRRYGTNISVIKAMMLTSEGLTLALMKEGKLKEFHIPLDDKIQDYQLQIEKRKLKPIFHEETLLVDIYTKANGVVYTLELLEYLFEEFL